MQNNNHTEAIVPNRDFTYEPTMASVELNIKNATKQDTQPLITTQPTSSSQCCSPKRKRNLPIFAAAVILIGAIVGIVIVTIAESSRSDPNLLYIYHEQSRIYTMDHLSQDMSRNTAVESICIDTSSKKFIYVGDASYVFEKCMSTNHASFKEIHFNGSMAQNLTILPGLIDAHAHILSLGSNYFRADLSTATSITEICDIIDAFIANNSHAINDNWIQGWGWDQELWNEASKEELIDGLPTRWMLDDRFPSYKLYLSRIDGHAAWINTAALNTYNNGTLPEENPVGGEIIRDVNDTVTGALVDTAMDYISNIIPPWTDDERVEMLDIVLKECSENGLTGVHDAGNSPSDIELFKSVIDSNEISFSLRLNAFASHTYEVEEYAHLKGEMYKDLLSVKAVKFYMDGALGSRGAALLEPYCDDNSSNGLLFYSPEAYYSNISRWHESGYQIATHAIGDAANREVIDAYIQLIEEYGLSDDHRLRIEHAQIVNASYDIPRIGQYHIIPSMQPTHATSDMPFAEDRLCEYRLTGAYAWQRMLNVSVPALPFGSDFPAVGVVNPFLGIYAAITRQNESGFPVDGWTAYNKVSRYQALKGYTYDAAFTAFQEDKLGTIAEGKYADLIVIDRDIFEVDAMEILDTNVIATYLGGSTVYVDPDWNGALTS